MVYFVDFIFSNFLVAVSAQILTVVFSGPDRWLTILAQFHLHQFLIQG